MPIAPAVEFEVSRPRVDGARRRWALSVRGLRVLVVDDNETNRRIFQEILRSWRMNPTTVSRGAEGLTELSRAVSAGEPYDLVILDCAMPSMDGFAFAERICGDEQLRRTKMIMVSSSARTGHADRCRQLGIIRYMTKPVVQSELLNTILSAFQEQAASDTRSRPSAQEPPAGHRGLKILLAEDSPINRQVAIGMLKMRGHTVVDVHDGRQAVSAWEEDAFDVILMDVQMPELDGFEATAVIREREKPTDRHTPIVAMTANAMKGDRERCLGAGMDSYIAKPIDSEQLDAVLEELVAGVSASDTPPQRCPAPAEAPAEPPLETAARPTEDAEGEASDVIDLAAARERIPGSSEAVKQMAQVSLSECPRMLQEIRDDLADRDAKRVQRGAHYVMKPRPLAV